MSTDLFRIKTRFEKAMLAIEQIGTDKPLWNKVQKLCLVINKYGLDTIQNEFPMDSYDDDYDLYEKVINESMSIGTEVVFLFKSSSYEEIDPLWFKVKGKYYKSLYDYEQKRKPLPQTDAIVENESDLLELLAILEQNHQEYDFSIDDIIESILNSISKVLKVLAKIIK